jgi:hypothetical protein
MWFSRNTKLAKMVIYVTHISECFRTTFELSILRQTLIDMQNEEHQAELDLYTPKKLLIVINTTYRSNSMNTTANTMEVIECSRRCTEITDNLKKEFRFIDVFVELEAIILPIDDLIPKIVKRKYQKIPEGFTNFLRLVRGMPLNPVRYKFAYIVLVAFSSFLLQAAPYNTTIKCLEDLDLRSRFLQDISDLRAFDSEVVQVIDMILNSNAKNLIKLDIHVQSTALSLLGTYMKRKIQMSCLEGYLISLKEFLVHVDPVYIRSMPKHLQKIARASRMISSKVTQYLLDDPVLSTEKLLLSFVVFIDELSEDISNNDVSYIGFLDSCFCGKESVES